MKRAFHNPDLYTRQSGQMGVRMKICFLARPSFDVYSSELYKGLKKEDASIKGTFITTNKSESNKVRKLLEGMEDVALYETSTYLREHWDEFDLHSLAQYEDKYSCAPIWEYIYTDRFLINREYDYVIKMAAGLFSFFEYVYEKEAPDFYYSECIATLQCYTAYLVGRKKNVQYLTQMCARGSLDSTYHYFTMDPYQYNVELEKEYINQDYAKEELARAEKYLSEFENKNITPPAMKLVKTKPKIDKSFIYAPVKYLTTRFDPNNNDPFSYMYYKSYSNQLNPIRFYFRYQKLKKYFHKPDYKKKYVFYPLHFQPEASTCVCAEKYEKQLYYIDSWAKSLPADTVLFVKEHYTLLGHRELNFYKELQKYPNVFLIDPWVSARELIVNSVAVTTLTGTAGFEAMLLRKPVFLGGNSVYENAPGVIKVTDIYGSYLPSIKSWEQPSREDVIKYLCACFRSYYKGNIYCQNYHHLLDGNIDDIVCSLYQKLNELYKK